MEENLSVIELDNNKYFITSENKKYTLTLSLNENSINFIIKKHLIMTNYEGIYLLDDLIKIHKIFIFYDNLENIFTLIKKKLIDKNFALYEDDKHIRIDFIFSLDGLSVKVPLKLHKNPEVNTELVLNEMTNTIILLSEKVNKLESLVGQLEPYEDSKIIKKGEMEKIKNWIDDKKCLQLKLLYRLSTDGQRSADFHSKCDGKGPTLVLIENTMGKRFGGYTNLKWNSNNAYLTNDPKGFIFSLDNMTKFMCSNQTYNIYGAASYGPTFGGGHDIYISDNSSSNNSSYCSFPHSYGSGTIPGGSNFYITGSYNFTVKDIEVYLVE